MNEKENVISFAGIKQMTKTEYYKCFKRPVDWKKAEAMICVVKHKFTNGKVPLVCIPYRKKIVALKTYKEEVKKELAPKFFLVASTQMVKQSNGKTALEITPLKGAANIKSDVIALFQKMKMEVVLKDGVPDNNNIPDPKKKTIDKKETSPVSPKQAEQQQLVQQFKDIVKRVKPELKKIGEIIQNINTNKITPQDIEYANATFLKIDQALKIYQQLPPKLKNTFVDIKNKLNIAEIKVEKIKTALIKVDSSDPQIMESQVDSIDNEINKLLASLGLTLEEAIQTS